MTFKLKRISSKKFTTTPFDDLIMKINLHDSSGVIETITLIRNNLFKFELTHPNKEVLEEIFENLKRHIIVIDFENVFSHVSDLWIENSKQVNKEI